MSTWYDITRDADYQALTPENKSQIKTRYFREKVLPDIDADPVLKDIGPDKMYQWFMQQPDDTGQNIVTSTLGSAARGFGEFVPGAIEGVGALTGIEEIRGAGQAVREGLEYIAPVNPIYEEGIPAKVAGVGGQIGSLVATAGVGGIASKALSGAKIAAGATAAEQAALASQAIGRGAKAASYLSSGLQGAAGGAQEAERYGLEGPEAYLRTLAGLGTAIGTEALPFGPLVETAAARRLLGEAVQGVPGIRRSAVTEAAEGASEQIGGNIATQLLAPLGTETPGVLEGVGEAAVLEGIGGGMFGALNRLTTPRTPTVATPPPVQPVQDVAANVAAADEGEPDLAAAPNVGTPVTLDGQNFTVTVPPGSGVSPDAVAGFYGDPDTLRALHDRGNIRLEQVITPTGIVDTTDLNNNVAASAAFAPQVAKTMQEIAVEDAAAPPAVEQPAASMPMMVTRDMRQQLTDLGYAKSEINAMRPEEAAAVITAGVSKRPLSQPAVTTAQEIPVTPAESDGGSLGQMTPAAGGSNPDVTETTVPQPEPVSSAEIAPAADPFAAAGEPVVATFQTAKGSTYEMFPDGTTVRNKAARPEHPGEAGVQPRSSKTLFVTEEGADALSIVQTEGVQFEIRQRNDGSWGAVATDGPGKGKFYGTSLTRASESPAVGLIPVEIWDRPGKKQAVHFGNKITAASTTPAQPAPVVAQPPTPTKRRQETRRPPKTVEAAKAAIAEQAAAAEFVSDLRAEGQEARVRQKKAAFITEFAEGRREPAFLQQLLSGGWDKALDDVQRGLVAADRAEKLARDAEGRGLIDAFTAGRFSRQPTAPAPVEAKPKKASRPKAVQPVAVVEPAEKPSPGPLRPKLVAGETVSFKENGQTVMGTVDEVNGDLVTITYNWNGQSEQRAIRNRSQVQRPVLAVAEEPNYKYTQEQNARKAARFGLPTQPGVTVNAGGTIKTALSRIAADTAMPQMLRAVARALQNQNYDGVDLRIEADGRRWYAGYYLNDNGITEIGINLRLVGRGQVDAVSVFLHEALHHVTLAKVRNPQGEIETQAVEALDTLRKRIKAYAGMQQQATKFSYELGSVDEFITALFTRPDFQDLIAGIPDTFVPGTPGSKFRSVLSEVFRVIAQLVTGQKVQKGGILDQSFASTLALFETPQRAARGQSVDYAMAEGAEPRFTPDEARAILTKRFGKDVADKINIEVMAPRRMGNREVEVDAELRDGTISLNLKFMDSEEMLIQKAEHEMAHAVFTDKGVQEAWSDLSASMPPDVRARITERMVEAGYDSRVLNEEVLVRFLEEVRASTPPSKWKAFMDAVIDAFRRFFGAMPDERTARLAAARIIAAGEAAVARGLDPAKQAFGQSVATQRTGVITDKYPGVINLEVPIPWPEQVKLAQDAIAKYKKASQSKDKVQVLADTRDAILTDNDIRLSTKMVALDLLAQQGSILANLAQAESGSQVKLDDFANITATANGVLESNPAEFADYRFTTGDELAKRATEAGRTLNIIQALARLTPEGYIRSVERVRQKKVDAATEQQFGTQNVMGEIEKLWRMMQEAGATNRGLAIAAALKAFMPSRKNAARLIDQLFPQAGIRDRMTKGGEGLVRDFFQMIAGPRDPKGPLAEFDESIQSALSSMLRKVMEARGLVADNQTAQATDIDKLVRSVSADPLRFDKIAAADAAMQDELAKIEDAERRATLQQAWEEATSKMYTNVANEATLRRAVNAELKAEGVKWNEMFDKGQKPAALRAKVVDAVMQKVGALVTGQTDPTAEIAELEKRLQAETDVEKQKQLREQIADVRSQANALKSNLDMLRSEVGAAFNFIAETKRVQWLAYRAGIEARRRVAERRGDMLAALRNRGVAESALMRLAEKMAGPQRPGAEPNPVSTLIGEHLKEPVEGFTDKLVALGVDQATADALDAISGTVRADLAKLAEANAVKRLTDSLKPKTKAAKSAIPRLLRVLLEAGKTGAFDSKAFNDALGEAFDLPPMTADQQKEIARLVSEINKLPQGAARVDKQQELMNYVALVQGVSVRDMLLSMWYANVLSGVSTQAIGLVGNTMNTVLRSAFLALTNNPADFANYIRGALGVGAQAGLQEVKAALGDPVKLFKGIPEQVRAQFKVGRLDSPEIANALEVLFRKGPTTIPEWIAYIGSAFTRMRAVFRIMSAIDAFYWNSAREGMYHLAASRTVRKMAKEKSMTTEEANAEFIRQLGGGPEAYEQALKDAEAALKKAGQPADMLTMDRMAREAIDKVRMKLNPEAVQAANRWADRIVFQNEPEGVGKIVSSLIRAIQGVNIAGFPLGTVLVPFNKIVSNLFEQSLDYTGLGLVRAALGMHISDARIDWSSKGMPGIAPADKAKVFDEVERRERAMAGFLGLTLSAAAYLAAKANMDDDDDEVPFMLYAFGPTNKNKRDQMPEGWVPFSIKIGDTYYRYAEWPLGMVLAGFAAALDAERYGNMKEKDTLDRIGYSAMLGLKGFMTQGVLSNVDTAIDVLMFKATGKKYTDIPANAVKGLIPAQGALRDVSSLFDNTKVSNDSIASALMKDLPFVKSLGTKPELNIFGEPTLMEGEAILRRFLTQRRPHAEADYLTRNKLYIPGMDETVTIGQYLPPSERDRFKRRAMQMQAMENGVFTAEQNYDFRKRAGELTKAAVQRIMKQAPTVRTEEQRKAVQNLIDKQVGLARRRAMVEAVPYQPPPAQ